MYWTDICIDYQDCESLECQALADLIVFGEVNNTIRHFDSPVYQCKKAFLLNIAVNCSDTLLNISWMAVELPGQRIHKSEPNSAALSVHETQPAGLQNV